MSRESLRETLPAQVSLCSIRPTSVFRALLQCAVQRSGSDVFLASQDDSTEPEFGVGGDGGRLMVGQLWQDNDLVFCNSFGKPLDGNNVRERSFKRLLERTGLPPMRFHNLRHGAATLLMAEGVNTKAISEMLGHADVTVTLKVYAHVIPAMHEQAATAMDRLFGTRL